MGCRRIYHYGIPADGEAHDLKMTAAPVLAVAAASRPGDKLTVEFWAEHDDDHQWVTRTFTVVGTGWPVPDGYRWRGTCARLDGLIWHLCEMEAPS